MASVGYRKDDQDSSEESLLSTFSFRDLFHVLFRHKWKIIALSVVGGVMAGSLVIRTPEVYRSEAKLLLRYVTDSVALSPDAAGQNIAGGRNWENIFNSELEILKSKYLAEKTVDAIGVERIMESFHNREDSYPNAELREQAILFVHRNLMISTFRRSNIIQLAFNAPQAALSQKVLRTFIDAYLEQHLAIHRSAGAYEFLTQQTDQLRGKLTQTEETLRALMKVHAIDSVEEKRMMLSGRISSLKDEIQGLYSELSGSKARLTILRPDRTAAFSAPSESTSFEPSSVWTPNLHERLARLEAMELELLSSFTEESIPVQDVRRQISEAIMGLNAQTNHSSSSLLLAETSLGTYGKTDLAYLTEEAQMVSLEAKVKSLEQYLKETQDEWTDLMGSEGQIKQLQRELTVQEDSYKKFSENLEQARIDQALELKKISNISEVQPPTLPHKRIRPVEPRPILMMLVAGILGGIGLAFFMEFWVDRSLKRPREVEAKLKIPTLASIPILSENKDAKTLHSAGAEPLVSSNASWDKEETSWTIHDDVKGTYEWLCQQILFSVNRTSSTSPYLLGVTSCYAGEGVTTVGASMAITLSQQLENSVLLVDANLDGTSTHRIFDVPGKKASVDSASHDDAMMLQQNLCVLPAATVKGDVPKTYGPHQLEQWRNVVDYEKYSCVVFDMPALLTWPHASQMASLLHGLIFVVEAEKVRVEIAEKAIELLKQSKTNVVGAVLNKRRYYVPDWLYERI